MKRSYQVIYIFIFHTICLHLIKPAYRQTTCYIDEIVLIFHKISKMFQQNWKNWKEFHLMYFREFYKVFHRVSTDAGKTGKQHVFWKYPGKIGKWRHIFDITQNTTHSNVCFCWSHPASASLGKGSRRRRQQKMT